jgi:hypothetical protein
VFDEDNPEEAEFEKPTTFLLFSNVNEGGGGGGGKLKKKKNFKNK